MRPHLKGRTYIHKPPDDVAIHPLSLTAVVDERHFEGMPRWNNEGRRLVDSSRMFRHRHHIVNDEVRGTEAATGADVFGTEVNVSDAQLLTNGYCIWQCLPLPREHRLGFVNEDLSIRLAATRDERREGSLEVLRAY